jgi:hypothetical protein
LRRLPDDVRPALDPPLPDRTELLAECDRAGHALLAMSMLYDLASERIGAGDGLIRRPREGTA